MNNIQEIREKAAAFLDEIRTGVAEIIKQPGKGFDFSELVKNWDYENECGTVCCMEGWIPAIRPDLARWEKLEISQSLDVLCINSIARFKPHKVGLPISYDMWWALTRAYSSTLPDGCLYEDSPFKDVAALWERTAARIRAGELDHLLIFEQ